MIPFWKKWLSWLAPLTLESGSSVLNPELSVILSKGRLQLISGNAIYSWDDLYHNFTRLFESLDMRSRPRADVLLLGLGLGSVPYILEKKYGRRYAYTIVELDEMVADMASRYALDRLDSPVEIVVADALTFVEVCQQRFDMVIMDVFEDEMTPPQFETDAFLDDCIDLLRPGGILIYNRLANSEQQKRETNRFFERKFKRAAPEAAYLDTGGNWMLYAYKL
ncbi:MAG: spermidine synthase [Saprospiraceae bacterium]